MKIRSQAMRYGSGMALLAGATSVQALEQADLDAISTAVAADMALITPWAYTIMAVVLVASIGIGLVRRFTHKATGA